MGRKKPGRGAHRRDASRNGKPARGPRNSKAAPDHSELESGPARPSRLLLTRLLHGGTIWAVYVATGGAQAPAGLTRLEFEARGPEGQQLRLARPAEGALLEALHRGAPVSRAQLERELELAELERDLELTPRASDRNEPSIDVEGGEAV